MIENTVCILTTNLIIFWIYYCMISQQCDSHLAGYILLKLKCLTATLFLTMFGIITFYTRHLFIYYSTIVFWVAAIVTGSFDIIISVRLCSYFNEIWFCNVWGDGFFHLALLVNCVLWAIFICSVFFLFCMYNCGMLNFAFGNTETLTIAEEII
jgi:hypothetical protein